MLLKTLTHWMPLRFQLLVFLTLIFCLGYIANNHAFASEPTTRIYGYFESGITDQYLVAVEVCAGSEKFESPQIYLSSDIVIKKPIIVNAIIGKNSCILRDYTIKAMEPKSITVGFSDTTNIDSEKIKKLEQEIEELKNMIGQKTDSADKKTADVKTSKKTDSKKTHSKKQNSENNLVLIPEDIRDSRKWEVRDITYRNPENRYFFSSDYDVKSRVEQTYATSSKILSAKYQYTLYSLVEIFKKEPKPILDDSYFFPFQDQTVAINLGNASCYTFKDNSETDFLPVSSYYECSIGNARILVQGLKMTSLTTNEDVAKEITKSIIDKLSKYKDFSDKPNPKKDTKNNIKSSTTKKSDIQIDKKFSIVGVARINPYTTLGTDNYVVIQGKNAKTSEKVTFKIFDSKNNKISEFTEMSDFLGSFTANWYVAKGTPSGKYTIKASSGPYEAETNFELK